MSALIANFANLTHRAHRARHDHARPARAAACPVVASVVSVASVVLVVSVVSWAGVARADEPPAPVFDGHPMLATYTKEAALEGGAARLGDGRWSLAAGSSLAAFYAPWFSLQGAAHTTLRPGGGPQTYDTRAVARFGTPRPLAGRFFFYAGGGFTVFFVEQAAGGAFDRGLGPVVDVGAWAQLGDRVRLRLDVRDHWLVFGKTDLAHNLFVGLSLVTLYR